MTSLSSVFLVSFLMFNARFFEEYYLFEGKYNERNFGPRLWTFLNSDFSATPQSCYTQCSWCDIKTFRMCDPCVIYISDLPDVLSSNAKLFADDTSLFPVVRDINTSVLELNSYLKKNQWLGFSMENNFQSGS